MFFSNPASCFPISGHTAALMALAVAIAAGQFSLAPESATLFDLILQPRYAGFAAAAVLGLSSHARLTANSPQPGVILIAAALTALAAFAVSRSALVAPQALTWFACEPVILTAIAALLTVWLVRTPDDARLFLTASAACLSAAGLGLAVYQALDTSPAPVAPFFASRGLFAGSIGLMYLAWTEAARTYSRLVLLGLACLLLFLGLNSEMRVAVLLYPVALGAALLLLTARRHRQAVLAILAITGAAYSSHALVNAEAASAKFHSYAPTVVREDTPRPHQPDVAACLDRAGELLDAAPTATELRTLCNRFFTVDDRDARIRLILHALSSNTSVVAGSGLGTYRFIDAARPDSPAGAYAYPHNILAETYHAAGTTGLVFLSAAILAALMLTLRAAIEGHPPVAILTAIPVFAAAASLLGGDLYDARYLWIIPIVLTALTTDRKPSEDPS